MTRNMLLEIHPEGDIMLSGKSRTLRPYIVMPISYGPYRMAHIVCSIPYGPYRMIYIIDRRKLRVKSNLKHIPMIYKIVHMIINNPVFLIQNDYRLKLDATWI